MTNNSQNNFDFSSFALASSPNLLRKVTQSSNSAPVSPLLYGASANSSLSSPAFPNLNNSTQYQQHISTAHQHQQQQGLVSGSGLVCSAASPGYSAQNSSQSVTFNTPGFQKQPAQTGNQPSSGIGKNISNIMMMHLSNNASFPSNEAAKNTLWMGDLDPWMDESFIKQIWAGYNEQVNVKMIRDKFTGMNAGYCFVEFSSPAVASKCLNSFNGLPIPNTSRLFKLNWASGGGINDRKDQQGPEYSIFVGDLGPEVHDQMLMATFLQRYPSCKTAKVVTDAVTGLSRGYGFVRFSEESDQQRAMVEMQGLFCGSRPMRISVATPKNRFGNHAHWNPVFFNPGSNTWGMNPVPDLNNTTVFVGGLTNNFVTEEDLGSYFAPFGPIAYVKIPPGKGCGFVSFVHRQSAEMAISSLNGCVICGNRVRLSWGRNASSAPNSPSFSETCTPTLPLNGLTTLPASALPSGTVGNPLVWKQSNLSAASGNLFSSYPMTPSPEKDLLSHQPIAVVDASSQRAIFNNEYGGNSPPSLVDIDSNIWKSAQESAESLQRPSSTICVGTAPPNLFQVLGAHNQQRPAGFFVNGNTPVKFTSAPNSPDHYYRSTASPSPLKKANIFHQQHQHQHSHVASLESYSQHHQVVATQFNNTKQHQDTFFAATTSPHQPHALQRAHTEYLSICDENADPNHHAHCLQQQQQLEDDDTATSCNKSESGEDHVAYSVANSGYAEVWV